MSSSTFVGETFSSDSSALGVASWAEHFLSISKMFDRSHEQPATASGLYPVRDCREVGHIGITCNRILAATTAAPAISDGLYCQHKSQQTFISVTLRTVGRRDSRMCLNPPGYRQVMYPLAAGTWLNSIHVGCQAGEWIVPRVPLDTNHHHYPAVNINTTSNTSLLHCRTRVLFVHLEKVRLPHRDVCEIEDKFPEFGFDQALLLVSSLRPGNFFFNSKYLRQEQGEQMMP